jgi:hypothetical protein
MCTKLYPEYEGKRRRERLGPRWDDSININLEEMMCEIVDWIHVALNGSCGV